ncbi:hypothetical protein CC79DRAFT_1330437 [Sarocladium strictum]
METWNQNVAADLYAPLQGTLPLRILKVHPGTGDDPIQCDLIPTHLDIVAGAYDATSYTWGSPENPQSIQCNGLTLKVQRNAFDMLMDLRAPDRSRTVWIDAICINQGDIPERGQQVSFMHRIYSSARSVQIWLGRPDAHSIIALRTMAGLDSAKYVREHQTVIYKEQESSYRDKTCFFDRDARDETEAFKEEAIALVEFVSRPWFNRVWVQQEAAVCRHLHISCGRESVEWSQVFSLAWILLPAYTIEWPDYLPYPFTTVQRKLRAIVSIQSWRTSLFPVDPESTYSHTSSLVSLLWQTQNYEATDPRDKIFALQNLCFNVAYQSSNPERFRVAYPNWAPEPNYETPWEVLYTDLTLRLFEQGYVSFLGRAGKTRHPEGWQLPSWVVDFRSHSAIKAATVTDLVDHEEWFSGGPPDDRRSTKPDIAFRPKISQLPKAHRRRLDQSLLSNQFRSLKGPSKQLVQSVVSVRSLMKDEIVHVGATVCDPLDDNALEHFEFLADRGIRAATADIGYIQQRFQQRDTYVNGDTMLDAYKLALLAATDHEEKLVGPEYVQRGFDEYMNWLKVVNEKYIAGRASASAKTLKDPPFARALSISGGFVHFRFACTKHGYFCLVPAMTQIGDTVAILKGCRKPVVLRPWTPPGGQASGTTAYFEHLGDAYVHGMMLNQAGCICTEFGCKEGMTPAQREKVMKAARRNEGEVWKELGFGDYSEMLPTIAAGWINLV